MDLKRFNNPEYKNQIKAIRNYRRAPRLNPETPWSKFLQLSGLSQTRNQIFTFVILAVIIYFAYFAKFLFIQEVVVDGGTSEIASEINDNFQQYSHSHRWLIFPQKNILFFSKAGFRDYLLKNDYRVATVNKISSRLWNHLAVQIEPRVPKYTLEAGGKDYVLNSDFTIGAEIPSPVSEDQKNLYTLIKDTADEQVAPGDKFLEDRKGDFVNGLVADIAKKLSLKITSMEIPGKASDQLIVSLDKGPKVYFSTSTDEAEFFQRMSTLWLKLTPEQQGRLAYFDLRFDKNAYSCYKTDPCAQENTVPNDTNTNTQVTK